MSRYLTSALGLACAAPAWSQQATPIVTHDPSYYLLRALLSLAFVVGLIYLAYFLLRRLQGVNPRYTRAGPAEVVQSLILSGGNVLHLVRLGRKVLAITCGPQGARAVGEFDWEEMGESEEGGAEG